MKKLFFLILFTSLQALAAITELKSYNDLDLSQIDSNTLVIFDIDNTLIRQDSMVGTHQWGDYIRDRAIAKGIPVDDAKAYQYKAFAELQPYLNVVPVENKVMQILNFLSKNKVPHFALTARSGTLKKITSKQIRILNHDFLRSFPLQKDDQLLHEHLYQGIIFSGDVPKGELLNTIIENSITPPKKIIFIDDKKYNLDSVESSLANSPIILESRRYGAADSELASFNPVIADLIYSFFKEFHVVLPVDEAIDLHGDLTSIVDLRFDYYLQEQGPLVKAIDGCKLMAKNVTTNYLYTCNYLYDGSPASIDFEFTQENKSKSIYFGKW
jgi:FMN phosphatase YigB (HAD superfamily)